jgi:hypothetical protein
MSDKGIRLLYPNAEKKSRKETDFQMIIYKFVFNKDRIESSD